MPRCPDYAPLGWQDQITIARRGVGPGAEVQRIVQIRHRACGSLQHASPASCPQVAARDTNVSTHTIVQSPGTFVFAAIQSHKSHVDEEKIIFETLSRPFRSSRIASALRARNSACRVGRLGERRRVSVWAREYKSQQANPIVRGVDAQCCEPWVDGRVKIRGFDSPITMRQIRT